MSGSRKWRSDWRHASGSRSWLGAQALALLWVCLPSGYLPGVYLVSSSQTAVAQVASRRSRPQSAPAQSAPAHIRPPVQCPSQLESLMPLLLRDLPAYTNRVSQRVYGNHLRTSAELAAGAPGYMLLAGRPEYQPLSLAGGEYRSTSQNAVPQVFFTTLERQYETDRSVEFQHYHWLFIAPNDLVKGRWRLVLMQSSLGEAPANEPPTPPHDSSQGVIAEAIRIWLRDCEAGSIVGPENLPENLPETSPENLPEASPVSPRTDRQS